MKTILVIEDESSIRNLLRITLESNGYKILESTNGRDGLEKQKSQPSDLIILDLGLPDINGHHLIKELRKNSSVPIIVLTVLDSDNDKVLALDGGADDYLTKPFSTPELLVRIRVALRRIIHQNSFNTILNCGPIEMNQEAHLVKVDGVEIKLSVTEYKILQLLLQNKGRVVLHQVLLNEVWGPNSIEHLHYLRVYLGNLRKKIKSQKFEQDLIITESGVGYRLVDPDFI